jgi:hypothetical protein
MENTAVYGSRYLSTKLYIKPMKPPTAPAIAIRPTFRKKNDKIPSNKLTAMLKTRYTILLAPPASLASIGETVRRKAYVMTVPTVKPVMHSFGRILQ